MTIQQDFRELLRLLEENEVDYLIIGGYAVAFHGYPRFTKDLDIFFRNSPENIQTVKIHTRPTLMFDVLQYRLIPVVHYS